MVDMLIREATPDDAQAITAIYNDAIVNTTAILWSEPKPVSYWRDQLTDRPAIFPAFVAIADGGVVGFAALFQYDTKCGYQDVAEWSLYVAPDARGQGVGLALSEALFAAGRGGGLHSVLARITQGNIASEKLHERLGFTKVGTFEKLGNKFGQRHDVLIYQLVLGG